MNNKKFAYLLAQMRAASRASELSCSYSLDTMWTQRGNSSTFARLRPRSKMRIFGSGTPRLNLDFGYGFCELAEMPSRIVNVTDLILAVAVASRGSSGHYDDCLYSFALLANVEEERSEAKVEVKEVQCTLMVI